MICARFPGPGTTSVDTALAGVETQNNDDGDKEYGCSGFRKYDPIWKVAALSSPEQQRPAVGFIGPGDQGAPMAQAIGDRGLDLHVWARPPKSLEAVADVPHSVHTTVDTVHTTVVDLVATSDILALRLRDASDIWDVLHTPGVREHLRPGTAVVDHGTGDPART